MGWDAALVIGVVAGRPRGRPRLMPERFVMSSLMDGVHRRARDSADRNAAEELESSEQSRAPRGVVGLGLGRRAIT